jgi:hypothetical protein
MVNLKFSFLVILSVLSSASMASVAPTTKSSSTDSNPQMINLNLQFKSRNNVVKSDLAMPFYQTAELERKLDNKNVFIEVNPRRGKNNNEVAIEMKFFKSSGAKAFAKKEIIAKIGEESKISIKGMTVRVTPVLN